MPEKMNLDYFKLLCCEFQKYETVCSRWSAEKKKSKHANTSYKATKHIERTFLMKKIEAETGTTTLYRFLPLFSSFYICEAG